MNKQPDQDELIAKLHLLHTSQAITMVGSFELDFSSLQLLWTDAMFMLHGMPVTINNKVSLLETLKLVHPHDRDEVERQLLEKRRYENTEFDFRIITHTGEHKILHAWCVNTIDEDDVLVKRGSYQDITRQKTLENELQARNEELNIKAELTEHAEALSRSGSYEWNLNTGEIKYSANLYRLLDATPGRVEPSFDFFLSLVHPDDKEKIINNSRQLNNWDEVVTINYRIVHKKGVRRIQSRNKKIINSRGETLILGSMLDVTEEHQTLQKLQERTLLAESISDTHVDMIAAFNTQLKFIWWNKQCEQQFNLPRQEVLGKHISEVFPKIAGTEMEQSLLAGLNGELVHKKEQRSPFNGLYYETFVVPLKEQDKLYGVLVLTHDLTEIKASTRQLQILNRKLEERTSFAETLVETSVDAIASYDTQLNIIAWNKACEQRFRKSKDEVLGKHVLDVFPLLAKDERYQDMQQALKGKSFFYSNQYSAVSNSFYQSYLLPLENEKHEIFGLLSITHDITELKKSAEQLEKLNTSLEQKNKELEKTNNELISFSYVASHDLQEPLRKIRTFSERLLDREAELLTDTGKDYLKRMDSASLRMQRLIEDLLTLSRTNTLPRKFEKTDLNKLLQQVQQNLNELIEETGATINAEKLPEANVIPLQFQQLLENLLINSIKYRKQNEPLHIHIGATQVHPADLPFIPSLAVSRFHKIAIADNGIGFEQQYAEKIFEIFQRLHGKQEYSGTGIGLAICRKTMENHFGYINAEAEPGKGACFNIYLPDS